jgi:hypothetical protein
VDLVVGGLDGEDLAIEPRVAGHGLIVDVEAQGLGNGRGFLGQRLKQSARLANTP